MKLNPKWIRNENGMSQEDFAVATGLPLYDVITLEQEKRPMTDLEEKMIDAWRGGYKPAQVEQALKTVQMLREDLAKSPPPGKKSPSFQKHFNRLSYEVARERRMRKSAQERRNKEIAAQDARDMAYYSRHPEAAY